MTEKSDEKADGIVLVDKPPGITSFGVVARIRRCFRPGKVGHGGTLDPEATGLLVILVGKACRSAGQFLGGDKSYLAGVRLGRETDTQDITGQTLSERDPGEISPERLARALATFRGEILQIPPMFSALKHRGRALYRLAREGKEVPREPRRVRIAELESLGCSGGLLQLAVTCSKGTYIRTLAHDLGRELGCGACLEWLRRTAVGPWRIEQARPLEEVLSRPLADSLISLNNLS